MEGNTTGIKTLKQTKVVLFLVITKLKKGQQGVSSRFFLRNQKRAYSVWDKPIFAISFFLIKDVFLAFLAVESKMNKDAIIITRGREKDAVGAASLPRSQMEIVK